MDFPFWNSNLVIKISVSMNISIYFILSNIYNKSNKNKIGKIK